MGGTFGGGQRPSVSCIEHDQEIGVELLETLVRAIQALSFVQHVRRVLSFAL